MQRYFTCGAIVATLAILTPAFRNASKSERPSNRGSFGSGNGSTMRILRNDRDLHTVLVTALLLLSSCDTDRGANVTQLPMAEIVEARLIGDRNLTNVRAVLPGTGSEIWVLDAVEPFLHVLRSDGSRAVAFGRAGRGVGEMQLPVVLLSGEPAPQVWDRGTLRRLRLSPGGDITDGGRLEDQLLFPARSDIEDVSYGQPFRARRVAGSVLTAIYPHGISADIDFRSGRIVRLSHDGIEVVFDFRDLVDDPSQSTARNLVGIPLWDACPDGSLHVLDPDHRTLLRISSDGSPRDTLQLPLPIEPLELGHIRRYLRRLVVHELGSSAAGEPEAAQEIEQLARELRDEFGAHVPPAADLLCDASGRFWIAGFDNSIDPRGYGRDWLVVDGESFRRVRFPIRYRPLHVGERRTIGILTDSFGVQRIATAKLPIYADTP